jgi:hypothetical protein
MDFKASLQALQMIINELTGSSFVHKMQGLLFRLTSPVFSPCQSEQALFCHLA